MSNDFFPSDLEVVGDRIILCVGKLPSELYQRAYEYVQDHCFLRVRFNGPGGLCLTEPVSGSEKPSFKMDLKCPLIPEQMIDCCYILIWEIQLTSDTGRRFGFCVDQNDFIFGQFAEGDAS